MGTTRIKVIDLSAGEVQLKTSRKRAERGLSPEEIAAAAKKTKKVPKEKPQVVQEQEAQQPVTPETKEEITVEAPEFERPAKEWMRKAKVRSKKYQERLSAVNRQKFYPIEEAVELIKKGSYSKFDGAVEVHLVLEKPAQASFVLPHPFNKTEKITAKTEPKFPIIHLAIGKVSQNQDQLKENIAALILAIGTQRVKKAYIAPTMGPSVKLDLKL